MAETWFYPDGEEFTLVHDAVKVYGIEGRYVEVYCLPAVRASVIVSRVMYPAPGRQVCVVPGFLSPDLFRAVEKLAEVISQSPEAKLALADLVAQCLAAYFVVDRAKDVTVDSTKVFALNELAAIYVS